MGTDLAPLTRVGRTGYLTINRADAKNALSNAVLAGLREGVAKVKADPDIRVLVLRGAGDEAFCAGGDLREMGSRPQSAFDSHLGRGNLACLFRDLWDLGKPTVARVAGFALAGGFGLAAACDFIVAADNAVFGVPEINVGLWPYMITVPLLHWMTPKQALDLMLTGRRIHAEEALSRGMVSRLVPLAELDSTVESLSATLQRAAPQSVALGRTAFYSVANHDLDSRLRMLEAMLTVNLGVEDAREGLAAFAEKRAPAWLT